MEKTFIKLFRSLLDWEWYSDNNTKALFIHCLLKANFKNKVWRGIEIKRGSFLTSLDSLTKETGLSVQNIRTSLRKLESTNELTSKSNNKYRIVTLKNYEKYNEVTNNQQATNKQLTTTNKDNKEIKELYNQIVDLSNIRNIQGQRQKHLNARIEQYSLEEVKEVLELTSKSDFLRGYNDRKWKCDFDWLMNPNNFIKVLEGKYNKEDKKVDNNDPTSWYEDEF